MNRRKFVVTSTVAMVVIAGAVLALTAYSTLVVSASVPALPEVLAYLPADSQAVFGMNVQKFVSSPVYQKFEAQHGQEIGSDLAEIIDKTGVDPRRDVDYVIAAVKPGAEPKGQGVLIATGRFDREKIVGFIRTKVAPIELEYYGASVVMIPENKGNQVEKGIAFLGGGEVAVGDLTTLKAAIDARREGKGVLQHPVLGPMLMQLDPTEMFWFAGDATSVIAKAPTNTPLGGSIKAIQNIFGTLNITDAISGKIVVTAADEKSAQQLADVAKGLVALGQLAGNQSQNTELSSLLQGISIVQKELKIELNLNFPIELLEKLEHARPGAAVKKVV